MYVSVSFRCLSLSETQHWLNEDRQEGDEEIYGWPDHKLLHLISPWMFDQNDHPSSNSRSSLGLRARSVVEQPGVTAVLPNARGSKVRSSCFYEGDIVGRAGLGLGPGSRSVVEGLVWQFSPGGNSLSVYIHPVLEQATASHVLTTLTASFLKSDMGHTEDKGKGQINNSKTETVLINSMEWQGRYTLISAVHWRTHFSDGDSFINRFRK